MQANPIENRRFGHASPELRDVSSLLKEKFSTIYENSLNKMSDTEGTSAIADTFMSQLNSLKNLKLQSMQEMEKLKEKAPGIFEQITKDIGSTNGAFEKLQDMLGSYKQIAAEEKAQRQPIQHTQLSSSEVMQIRLVKQESFTPHAS